MEVEIYQMTYKMKRKKENEMKHLNEIRILGDEFVLNNLNKGSMIINNKKIV